MLFFKIIIWVIFMYGLLSLIQDGISEFTYKKYNKNVKIYICVKDFENQIESVKKEIERVKVIYKNVSINVVNMDNNFNYPGLDKLFEDSNLNIYSKEEYMELCRKW